MSTLARTAIAVMMLFASTAASACGTLSGQSASAGSRGGTSSSGTGVGTSDSTASAAGTGTSFSHASASAGRTGVSTSPTQVSATSSTNSGSGAATADNQVTLGAAFQGTLDFGRVVFPQRKSRTFELVNGYEHAITVVTAAVTSTAFLVSQDDCDGRELQPHDYCAISITFSPPSRHGGYEADLKVTIKPDGPNFISMSGSEGPPVAPISTATAPVDNPSGQATDSPSPTGPGSPSA